MLWRASKRASSFSTTSVSEGGRGCTIIISVFFSDFCHLQCSAAVLCVRKAMLRGEETACMCLRVFLDYGGFHPEER